MIKLFKKADKNNDGFVSGTELSVLMFELADVNVNRLVTLDEVFQLLTSMSRYSSLPLVPDAKNRLS